MEEITSLDITGYDDRPLVNTFFHQTGGTGKLALFFPGRGYTSAMPLLYYPTRLAVSLGAEALWIDYSLMRAPAANSMNPEVQLRWLAADSSAALRAALARHSYREILLVGKSLGTLVLAHLALNEPVLKDAKYVWLTPLVRNAYLQPAVEQARPASLFIQGSGDPHYEAAGLARLESASGGQVLLVPEANHSLEIPGDLPASLQAVQQALQAISAFTGWSV